jgi:hypothetical protein
MLNLRTSERREKTVFERWADHPRDCWVDNIEGRLKTEPVSERRQSCRDEAIGGRPGTRLPQ